MDTYRKLVFAAYDNGALNDNAAAIAEKWAREALVRLEEKVVMSKLVHRDFENEIANDGELVHTHRPRNLDGNRKDDTEEIVESDAILDQVDVPLDQHIYESVIIKDGEWSKSFADLVRLHLAPQVDAVAKVVDRSIVGQVHRFMGAPDDRVGRLEGLSASTTQALITEAREKMEMNNVPEDPMWRAIFGPVAMTKLRNTDLFVKVNESGREGALRRAEMGELFDYEVFNARNVPYVGAANVDRQTGSVTGALAANEQTALEAVTLVGLEATAGEFATIAGNDQPQYVTAATTGAGDTTAITLNEAQKFASSAAAVLQVYRKVLVNNAAGYAAKYKGWIQVDGFSTGKPPQKGQLIAQGTGAGRHMYTIVGSRVINATDQEILLDRPLEVALADDDPLFPGPAGGYNLAFHRDALALVTRPLAMSPPQLGSFQTVLNSDTMSLRVTMQYDSKKQGTRVTVDILAGVALLNPDLAVLMLS